MFFVRATLDPEADLKRGFSGVYNAWCDNLSDIPDAIEDCTEVNLPTPRQDPVTGWWCWQWEDGLSSFALDDEATFKQAMDRVLSYGEHLGCVALFEADDFDIGKGSDREDLFRDGRFLGWLEFTATFEDVQRLGKPAISTGVRRR